MVPVAARRLPELPGRLPAADGFAAEMSFCGAVAVCLSVAGAAAGVARRGVPALGVAASVADEPAAPLRETRSNGTSPAVASGPATSGGVPTGGNDDSVVASAGAGGNARKLTARWRAASWLLGVVPP